MLLLYTKMLRGFVMRSALYLCRLMLECGRIVRARLINE